jgi:hypothetical protein
LRYDRRITRPYFKPRNNSSPNRVARLIKANHLKGWDAKPMT